MRLIDALHQAYDDRLPKFHMYLNRAYKYVKYNRLSCTAVPRTKNTYDITIKLKNGYTRTVKRTTKEKGLWVLWYKTIEDLAWFQHYYGWLSKRECNSVTEPNIPVNVDYCKRLGLKKPKMPSYRYVPITVTKKSDELKYHYDSEDKLFDVK